MPGRLRVSGGDPFELSCLHIIAKLPAARHRRETNEHEIALRATALLGMDCTGWLSH